MQKRSVPRNWDDSAQAAFADLKSALMNAPILLPPDWSQPFRVHIDASQIDVEGRERAIAHSSQKLTAAEQNYTANERELLALISALQRFLCYLEGSTFDVLTDNQIMEHFLTKKSFNRHEARWLDIIASFNVREISVVRGKIHVLGDSLSRIPDRLSI